MLVVSAVVLAPLAGCTEAPLSSEEIGQQTAALCSNGDGINSVMAALAVVSGKELRRWQSSRDFRIDEDGRLALTATGRARCADGECWNTEAVLDLQLAEPGSVKLGRITFDADAFSSRLNSEFLEQQRCDNARGTGALDCSAEEHELTFKHQRAGACDTIVSFLAKAPSGRALKDPDQLANKLIFVGYPENDYLSFQAAGAMISIDPTYGLDETGSSSVGSCTAACTKVSSVDISGSCCSCNGRTATFVRSAWNTSTYLCQA
jgi:hypothetical protein